MNSLYAVMDAESAGAGGDGDGANRGRHLPYDRGGRCQVRSESLSGRESASDSSPEISGLQTRYGNGLEGVDCYEGIPPGRNLIVDSAGMEAAVSNAAAAKAREADLPAAEGPKVLHFQYLSSRALRLPSKISCILVVHPLPHSQANALLL